jgi:hypothetical protein
MVRDAAQLQTCQDAQNRGLYGGKRLSTVAIHNGASRDPERRYIWLNFDIDIVSIRQFIPRIHVLTKRLDFELENVHGISVRTESAERRTFPVSIKSPAVLCRFSDPRNRHGTLQNPRWPCGEENVSIPDANDIPINEICPIGRVGLIGCSWQNTGGSIRGTRCRSGLVIVSTIQNDEDQSRLRFPVKGDGVCVSIILED